MEDGGDPARGISRSSLSLSSGLVSSVLMSGRGVPRCIYPRPETFIQSPWKVYMFILQEV